MTNPVWSLSSGGSGNPAWAVCDGWYELLRNWVLGTALKAVLGCEEFVLVNLLRRRHERGHGEGPRKEFAERAYVLMPA